VTGDRIRVVTPAARAVHKLILRGFATAGHVPDRTQLAMAAPAGHDLWDLLRELHDRDVALSPMPLGRCIRSIVKRA